MPTSQSVAVTVLGASSTWFWPAIAAASGSSHSGAPRATKAPPSASSQPEHPAARVPGETANPRERRYPLHTGIVATTFSVGVFDPHSSDGSQVISTYDTRWMQHNGGCDRTVTAGRCETERRVAADGFFPTRMTPRETLYLDLPFDDINDPAAFSQRAQVIRGPMTPATPGMRTTRRSAI